MDHVLIQLDAIGARPSPALHIVVSTLNIILPLVYHCLSPIRFCSICCCKSSFHLGTSSVVTGRCMVFTNKVIHGVCDGSTHSHSSTVRQNHVLRRTHELLDVIVIVSELEVILERWIVAQIVKALMGRSYIQIGWVLLVLEPWEASQVTTHHVCLLLILLIAVKLLILLTCIPGVIVSGRARSLLRLWLLFLVRH